MWLVIARVALARHGMAQVVLALAWPVACKALLILCLVTARVDLALRLVAWEALTIL